MNTQRSFFAELKRRNVYKVGAAYAVVAWLVLQALSILLPAFEVPPWVLRVFIAAIVVGFPIALIFAWAYELTPEGIKRSDEVPAGESIAPKTGRKLIGIVGVIAVVASGLFLYQIMRTRTPANAANASSALPEKSIAVLPFENLSEDKANAFFASGIQDEILTRLAKINSLRVISRTSTQQYQSKPSTVSEIARQLGVANILEGSVQKVGDAVHINVQLIKAATDAHLWAESYNRKLDNIFAVEAELATAIADQLNAKLTGSEKKELALKPTDNPAAYEAYLRGVTESAQDNVVTSSEAERSFEEAVRLDPKFALAWAALCRVHALTYVNNQDTSPARRTAAERAVAEAVRLQPQLPEVQLARATYQYVFLRDYKGARELLQQLRMIWPSNADIVQLIGWISARLGEYEKSADYLDQANVLNPRDLFLRRNTVTIHIALRDFSTAQRMADDALQTWPGDFRFDLLKVGIFQARGELTEAQSIIELRTAELIEKQAGGVIAYQSKLRRTVPPPRALQYCESAAEKPMTGDLQALMLWTDLLKASGEEIRAQALLAKLRDSVESVSKDQPNNWPLIAVRAFALAGLGARDAALSTVEQGLTLTANDGRLHGEAQELKARLLARFGDKENAIPLLQHLLKIPYDGFYGSPLTPALLRLDPDFDSLRGDPRFDKLCQEKPQ